MKKGILILLLIVPILASGCMLPSMFGNEAPVIQSFPSLTARSNNTYTYQVDAVDDSEKELAYSLLEAPDGMSINGSTGLLQWIPAVSQLGQNAVQIKVSDGWNSTIQEFAIEVNSIELESIGVLPEKMTITDGKSQAIASVTAYYSDGSSTSVAKTDCSYKISNSIVASVSATGIITAKSAGSATVTVSYSEDETTKSDILSVIVTPSYGGG